MDDLPEFGFRVTYPGMTEERLLIIAGTLVIGIAVILVIARLRIARFRKKEEECDKKLTEETRLDLFKRHDMKVRESVKELASIWRGFNRRLRRFMYTDLFKSYSKLIVECGTLRGDPRMSGDDDEGLTLMFIRNYMEPRKIMIFIDEPSQLMPIQKILRRELISKLQFRIVDLTTKSFLKNGFKKFLARNKASPKMPKALLWNRQETHKYMIYDIKDDESLKRLLLLGRIPRHH